MTMNYGLALLKIWMSFEVVLSHFWFSEKELGILLLSPFKVLKRGAVPVFMFTAFLLTGKYIISRNKQKISGRLRRLFIMQILWAAIYTAFFSVLAVFTDSGMFAGKSIAHVFMMFSGQVIFGQTVNAAMWFQADLIFITAMLAVIYFKFSDSTALILTWLCVIISFFLQYSGINFMMFGGLNPYIKFSLGRLCEMLPEACAGILFVKYGLAEKLQSRRKTILLFCAVILAAEFIFRLSSGSLSREGFGYSGMYLIVSAIPLTAMFFLLPLKNIPAPAKYVIRQISRFTPGIYCMHMLIASCLQMLTEDKIDSFAGCIVIYVLCLVISLAVSLFFRKGSKYLVE